MISHDDIPVLHLSYYDACPRHGFWDDEIVDSLLHHRYWRPVRARTYHDIYDWSDIPSGSGAVIVLPARHHATADYAEQLNRDMERLPWVLLILIGDEESAFRADLIRHPRIRIWTMMARPDDPTPSLRLLNGPAPHIHLLDNQPCPDKPLDYFFAGQVTHSRRQQCVENLPAAPVIGACLSSDRFTGGMTPQEYVTGLSRAKIAPCPSGPVGQDSFRFAEALEAGCIPIADAIAPRYGDNRYWDSVLGPGHPVPVIRDWKELPQLIENLLADWPHNANDISSWWMRYKRWLAYRLDKDIRELSGEEGPTLYMDDQVTVICLPFVRHRDTGCVSAFPWESVRRHFPIAEILAPCDNEQVYDGPAQLLLWNAHHRDRNVLPLVWREPIPEPELLRTVLENGRFVETPLTLIVNHPLPDIGIDWRGMTQAVLSDPSMIVALSGHYPVGRWPTGNYLCQTETLRRAVFEHFGPEDEISVAERMDTVIKSIPGRYQVVSL